MAAHAITPPARLQQRLRREAERRLREDRRREEELRRQRATAASLAHELAHYLVTDAKLKPGDLVELRLGVEPLVLSEELARELNDSIRSVTVLHSLSPEKQAVLRS